VSAVTSLVSRDLAGGYPEEAGLPTTLVGHCKDLHESVNSSRSSWAVNGKYLTLAYFQITNLEIELD
jgi:hypothetical protein